MRCYQDRSDHLSDMVLDDPAPVEVVNHLESLDCAHDCLDVLALSVDEAEAAVGAASEDIEEIVHMV